MGPAAQAGADGSILVDSQTDDCWIGVYNCSVACGANCDAVGARGGAEGAGDLPLHPTRTMRELVATRIAERIFQENLTLERTVQRRRASNMPLPNLK